MTTFLTATTHPYLTYLPTLHIPRHQKSHQHTLRKRPHPFPRTASSSVTVSTSSSSDCNGWDDPTIGSWSTRPDDSNPNNQLTDFMNSIGINDKKYVYVFVLGIVCSMTVSRVRLGWIVILPVFVFIFGLGFVLGFVKSVSDYDVSGGVRRKDLVGGGDDRVGGLVERLRGVVGVFEKLDARIGELRSYVSRAVRDRHVTIGELERCVVELDSMRSLAVPVRGLVESCVAELSELKGEVVEGDEKVKESDGFGFLKTVGSMFGHKRKGDRGGSIKQSKRDGGGNGIVSEVKGVAVDQLKGTDLNLLSNDEEASGLSKPVSDYVQQGDNARRMRVLSQGDDLDWLSNDRASSKFSKGEEYKYPSSKMRFADNSRLSFKLRHSNEIETWSSSDSILDSGDFSYEMKRTQTEATFKKEQTQSGSVESIESSRIFEHDDEDINLQRIRSTRIPFVDDYFTGASSPAISNDMLFDRHLTEANELLKQARDCLKIGDTEEVADDMLYKSCALLKRALVMKPMSLLAVGLLGNTYLLHGELKLKVSRKLRALFRNDRSSRRDWHGRKNIDSSDVQVVDKDALATLLVNTCEECEHLLVEAGRNYRMALSIDGDDVKSLYNWGLALSFRAQLIAEIGPEAAADADKVFMAAIDKFDAMMSKGNSYAPDALYRWGAALQQRSRLRPVTSKEKVKLLQQAKQLYEDALDMDSDNNQVKKALLRCTSELEL